MSPIQILLFSLGFLCSVWGAERCTNTVNDFENYLGTKTPYRIVANYNSSELKYEGCEATKMWALVRHGTRNPSLGLLDIMKTRLDEIRNLIVENLEEATDKVHNIDLDLFRSWSVKVKDKDEKKLTHEGEDEMLLLAERLQNRFPQVLSPIYSETWYKFKFTQTQRTKKSAEAFAAGLFGRGVVKDVAFPEPLKRDPVLRFYKLCAKWRKDVKNSPGALKEMRQFHHSAVMNTTVAAVNHRLGLKNKLNFADVHAMYMTCAFETAWNKRRRSPWCAPFTIEDLKILEFGEDLKYYWIDGYGHEVTYKQACAALTDLTDLFKEDGQFPKAVVYFTHSGTLLKMLAHMQLYKEEKHLRANDFSFDRKRNWKVSQLDSFGTNLVFVLFNCKGRKKILTLHQEHIVQLPSCPNEELCDLEQFLQFYTGASDCPFEEMCAADS